MRKFIDYHRPPNRIRQMAAPEEKRGKIITNWSEYKDLPIRYRMTGAEEPEMMRTKYDIRIDGTIDGTSYIIETIKHSGGTLTNLSRGRSRSRGEPLARGKPKSRGEPLARGKPKSRGEPPAQGNPEGTPVRHLRGDPQGIQITGSIQASAKNELSYILFVNHIDERSIR